MSHRSTPTPKDSNKIELKLNLSGVKRRLIISKNAAPRWEDLATKVKERFHLSDDAKIGLGYTDDEGDEITFSSDTEIQELWPFDSPSTFRVVLFSTNGFGFIPQTNPQLETVPSSAASTTLGGDDWIMEEDEGGKKEPEANLDANKEKEAEIGMDQGTSRSQEDNMVEDPPVFPLPTYDSATGSSSASASSQSKAQSQSQPTINPISFALRGILDSVFSHPFLHNTNVSINGTTYSPASFGLTEEWSNNLKDDIIRRVESLTESEIFAGIGGVGIRGSNRDGGNNWGRGGDKSEDPIVIGDDDPEEVEITGGNVPGRFGGRRGGRRGGRHGGWGGRGDHGHGHHHHYHHVHSHVDPSGRRERRRHRHSSHEENADWDSFFPPPFPGSSHNPTPGNLSDDKQGPPPFHSNIHPPPVPPIHPVPPVPPMPPVHPVSPMPPVHPVPPMPPFPPHPFHPPIPPFLPFHGPFGRGGFANMGMGRGGMQMNMNTGNRGFNFDTSNSVPSVIPGAPPVNPLDAQRSQFALAAKHAAKHSRMQAKIARKMAKQHKKMERIREKAMRKAERANRKAEKKRRREEKERLMGKGKNKMKSEDESSSSSESESSESSESSDSSTE